MTKEKLNNILNKYLQVENIQQTHTKIKTIAKGTSYYSPSEDLVCVPDDSLIFDTNDIELYHLSTKCHECIHSTMKTLERALERDEEELVAEMGAFMLIQKIQEDLSSKELLVLQLKQFTYLSCWANDKKKEEFNQVFTRVRINSAKAVDLILKEGE